MLLSCGGYLHIGHAKAINVNFGYAAANHGHCYLRYDDTNPEAEEKAYFDSILDTVEWLGFTPHKVTHSSDYFQELYEMACDLIKRNLAYACSCTPEQLNEQRGGAAKGARFNCPHRDRPVAESHQEFLKMKEGRCEEGEMTIRMKMDMQNPNPQFWDLVAYRILYTRHVKTGDQWCIYPTYDFTHCLVDSFENITHSMCTTEFQLSRQSYYWLCDALDVYKPIQWEYGRLNITKTVLSKRKLMKLVESGMVNGWDDPRLFTLVGLRRRGIPPLAINTFVRECGVTTSNSITDVRRLENCVRRVLEPVVPRLMCVLDPLKVVLTNLPVDHYEEFEASYLPKQFETGICRTRTLPFTNTLFIDRTDFQSQPNPNFFRLTTGGVVGLLHVKYSIRCDRFVQLPSGEEYIEASYMAPDFSDAFSLSTSVAAATPTTIKPKSYIQWVAAVTPSPSTHPDRLSSPIKGEIRIYQDLFLHDLPSDKYQVPNGWLTDINPHSLTVHQSYFERSLSTLFRADEKPEEQRVQLTRIGYFCVDRESKPRMEDGFEVNWVFNRTVSLKEDSKK